jgi:hypothetical protein
LLEFFEIEGRFPEYHAEVPEQAVTYLAEQVKVDPALFAKYQWVGRSSERHRARVRTALGFRECTEADQRELAVWLLREMCPTELRREQLRDAVLAHCRSEQVRLEPPTFGQISRLVASADVRGTVLPRCRATPRCRRRGGGSNRTPITTAACCRTCWPRWSSAPTTPPTAR